MFLYEFRTIVNITEEMFQARKLAMSDPEPDGSEYPTFGVNNDPESEGHLNLIDLRAYEDGDDDVTNDKKIPFDDTLWDRLLDQITWDEMTEFLSVGLRKTMPLASINKPETYEYNGANGLVADYGYSSLNNGLADLYKDKDINENVTGYPSNGVVASTFNKTLMEWYGRQWGEDGLWAGASGLYSMGVNIHRSPYGGRNFS